LSPITVATSRRPAGWSTGFSHNFWEQTIPFRQGRSAEGELVPDSPTISMIPEVCVVNRRHLALLVACVASVYGDSVFGREDTTPVTLEIRRAEFESSDGLQEATVEGTTLKVYLHDAVELGNADIAKASPAVLEDKSSAISVTFTAEGRRKMAKLSREHHNRPIAIVVDGKVVMAPVMKDEIPDDALITGEFTPSQVDRIARGLRGERVIARAKRAQPARAGGVQPAVDRPGAALATAALQGSWLWTTQDGTRTAPANQVRAEIKGDRLTITAHGEIVFDFSFTLDPNTSPKGMDMIERRAGHPADTFPAIYELNAGVLRICIASDADAPRPSEFESPPAEGTALIILTRKPPE